LASQEWSHALPGGSWLPQPQERAGAYHLGIVQQERDGAYHLGMVQ